MGNTRSRPINKTKISNEITNIALRKNKFGFGNTTITETINESIKTSNEGGFVKDKGISKFVKDYNPLQLFKLLALRSDKDATESCSRIMTEEKYNGIRYRCKGEARTVYMRIAFIIALILGLVILTLNIILNIRNKDKPENKRISNVKYITTYIIILLLFISIGFQFMARGNIDNPYSDMIFYYPWDVRQNQNQSLLIDPSALPQFKDKANIQPCNTIDLNECNKERYNIFYSLQGIKKGDDLKFGKGLEDWEFIKYIDGIFKIEDKKSKNKQNIKIAQLKNKTTGEIIESPFLLVGANCKQQGNVCVKDTDIGFSIDPIIERYKLDPTQSEINSKNYDDNLKLYTQIVQGIDCANKSQDICEQGTDLDGDSFCKWDNTKKECKKQWKPGRGHDDYWSCGACDGISNECSLDWRTKTAYRAAFGVSLSSLLLGIVSQFIIKDDNEYKKDYILRVLMVIISYFMFYYFGIMYVIYYTLRIMCPDGSDMGVIGRTDGWIYKYLIPFNPWKYGELFDFWRKEIKIVWYLPLILIILLIISTILQSIELGYQPIVGALSISIIFSIIGGIITQNINTVYMSIFVGWGIGLLGGSIWGMIEKSKDKPED